MVFKPTPLTITCNHCHSSTTWSAASDSLDSHEYYSFTHCTKCGSEDIERKPLKKGDSLGVEQQIFSWIKKQLGK